MNVQPMAGFAPAASMHPASREVYDAQHREIGDNEFGKLVRSEGQKSNGDKDADNAYDNAGVVHDFYAKILGRDSIDDKGMVLKSTVHFGRDYNNAYWDGQKMVYGDGDGEEFTPLSGGLDVVGHELTHGVTEHSSNLEYHNQPGALNESFSDVFGEIIEQYKENPTGFGTLDAAKAADWLIGEDVFTPGTKGDALRSMKAPGTGYRGDPQPAHMSKYKKMADNEWGDYGGVHINSGIPNKAAYEVGIHLGSEKLAKIWYETLTHKLSSNSSFQDAANATVQVAGTLYDSATAKIVSDAWKAVGLNAPVGSTVRPQEIAYSNFAEPSASRGVVPSWLTFENGAPKVNI
jgi:Zn-dependent metalloprotease